jgi:hypothetical protein
MAEKAATERALATIHALGGQAMWDATRPGQPVVGVELSATRIKDADLRQLAGLNELEVLYLSYTQVTDAGLVHLAALSRLRILILEETEVSDAGLTHLQGLSQLRLLDVFGIQVTEAGADTLQQARPALKIYH